MNKHIKNLDLSLLAPAALLTAFGLIAIYGASSGSNFISVFYKQAAFFAFSLFLFFLVSMLDLRFLGKNSYIVLLTYSFFVALLLNLLLVGRKIRGIRGWYKIGPFSFDPIPFVVISLVIILAKYFSKKHEETFSLKPIAFSSIYLALPFLLTAVQPDLGSAFIIFSVWFGIIIFSGLRLRHFFIISILIIILLSLSWNFWLEDYQKARIISFLNPNIDPMGISWNRNQSKIAIGAGGFLGKGIKNNSQVRYGFLPEARTDFIFSAIGEEFGFAGMFFVIILIFLIFYKTMAISLSANNNFLRLYSAGISFWIFSQSFVNIGMSLGFFPVMGIPLPFVSYGGSSLLGFYAALAILNSLKRTSRLP